MKLAARLFATEEMKEVAKEFVDQATFNALTHQGIINMPDERECGLMFDSFLAGAVWYKLTHEKS